MENGSTLQATLPAPLATRRAAPSVRATPFPPGSRLPGFLHALFYVARPTECIEWNGRTFGDTFTFPHPLFRRQVCVARPEAIKEVFTGDPELVRGGEANALLRPIVGDTSVLLQDGKSHLRKRRLILPPFHGDRMGAYTKVMVEETERAMASWSRGQTIALRPVSQQITLAVILRAVFGTDEGEEHRALADALRRWLTIGATKMGSLMMLAPALRRDLGPRSPWGRFVGARAKADELIYALIARRRREPSTGRTDVMSLLLTAKDDEGNPMTDTELRDELITLLIAGHETTAVTLCWLFEELLSRPDVMAEIQPEVATTDVSRLRILDAAIKETMRLRPILPAVARLLKEPARIAGYDLPANTLVVPMVHLTHRLPDIYPDPLTFRLERFLDKKIDPYAWLPFGGGVRRCIGMAFALQELKVITATMLARHKLRLAKGRARPVLRGATIAPSGDTALVVE